MKTEITIDEALKNKALKYKILQNMELQEENSNLTKILRTTVSGNQKATPEQIKSFKRVSRVSAISGS